MKIILRAEAVELGLKKYFTGEPCKHGHISERYTGARICVACIAAYDSEPTRRQQKINQQREYARTPQRIEAQRKRQTSPEYKTWFAGHLASPQGRAVKAKYRASTKGKAREVEYNASKTARAARTAYRASVEGKAREAEWRASPEGRAVIQANNRKRQALHRGCAVSLTKVEKAQMTAIYEKSIQITIETGVEHQVDHILPMSRGGLHHPDNLQVVTKAYNLAKKDLTEFEFAESLRTGTRIRVDNHKFSPVKVGA